MLIFPSYLRDVQTEQEARRILMSRYQCCMTFEDLGCMLLRWRILEVLPTDAKLQDPLPDPNTDFGQRYKRRILDLALSSWRKAMTDYIVREELEAAYQRIAQRCTTAGLDRICNSASGASVMLRNMIVQTEVLP